MSIKKRHRGSTPEDVNMHQCDDENKNGKVIGWARESYLGINKTILYDMNNNVKGYLKIDLMDSWKLRFVNK